jgi:MFS family permease
MSNIILLGLVSLFTDISTQMVYPILPLYLTAVMGASPAIIGIIEGIAESLASIVKLFSGIIADKHGHKKRLAVLGYASSPINKIIILFASTWTGVLIARIINSLGKGIRTAPRDAMIAESAQQAAAQPEGDKVKLGKAFGLHKGMDLLGTAIGILLAYLILSVSNEAVDNSDQYKRIFIYSLIPAFIGVVILLFVKEKKKLESTGKRISFNWKNLDTRLKFFMIFILLFTLGNCSKAFILLRAYNAGFSPQGTILLFFILNMTASLLSYPAGILSDKIGRKYILCAGYFLYGLVFFGIGLLSNNIAFIVLFVIYGIYTALTTGVARALIVDIVQPENKAGALGLHAAMEGIGLLPASLIAGFLWEAISPSAPFIFGGALGIITCIGVFITLTFIKGTI